MAYLHIISKIMKILYNSRSTYLLYYMLDILYLHCCNKFPQFGPKRLMRLANHFANFTDAFAAPIHDLIAAGIEQSVAEQFIQFRGTIQPEAEALLLAKHHIELVSFLDTAYPKLLHEISVAPPLLYYRGVLANADELALAVVGTRKISSYGRTILPGLLEPLVQAGITIVSGLAYGVDAAAHKLTLDYNGRTIAFLAGGVDTPSIYPKDHVLLAEEIVARGGAIISEYPPGTPALKQHFVARNRIISGMSVGTLLVECSITGGTLITAKHALEQNRTVYAVPGPIYSETSKGPNNIIKMGAQLVTEANDILSDLHIDVRTPLVQQTQTSTTEEKVLLDLLTEKPLHADTLIVQSGLEAGTVTTTLTYLEIQGRIRNVGGGQYIKIH